MSILLAPHTHFKIKGIIFPSGMLTNTFPSHPNTVEGTVPGKRWCWGPPFFHPHCDGCGYSWLRCYLCPLVLSIHIFIKSLWNHLFSASYCDLDGSWASLLTVLWSRLFEHLVVPTAWDRIVPLDSLYDASANFKSRNLGQLVPSPFPSFPLARKGHLTGKTREPMQNWTELELARK